MFALAVLVDLGSLLAEWQPGHLVAKPLLLPLLALLVVNARGPRALVAALLCGWGGDVLLLVDHETAFLAGMGCFAAGHVCYLVLFGRSGVRWRPAAGYALAGGVLVVLLWPGLPAGLRVPVAAYAVLLTLMACRATGVGRTAAAGGGLFLLSDALIAGGLAGWPALPGQAFWVMATYCAAQFLLVMGGLGIAVRARERAEAEARRVWRAGVRPGDGPLEPPPQSPQKVLGN
ncbi:lysoplasmalogenase [Streptomyces sp. NPDC005805]|uniref:lysoplasmalogenase n=1 Tax=Streptomyces sp. NPDC005805 TaxID=3157068 RepID=UPI0033D3237F